MLGIVGAEVMMSLDKKSATIHYEKYSINLWHEEGKVLDLVCFILTGYDSFESYIRCEGDTTEINLEVA